MAKASITSPRCTVCQHESRVVIDHLLAAGAVARATAKRFGLSKDAVSRHLASHISSAWLASVRAGPFGSEENLRKLVADGRISDLETLEAYRAIIGSSLIANVEVGAYATVAALLKSGHDNISLHARITGGLAPTQSNVTISVLQDPRTVRFVTRIMDLVRKHPETRGEVTALVRECFGEAEGPTLLDVTPEVAHA